MADEASEKEIITWVEKAIKNENIKEYTIEIESTNKAYGFIGNIVFVDVKGLTNEGEEKRLYLVVKFGKKSEELRTKLSLADYYARELYVYHTVIPSFDRFQASRKMKNFFTSVPKCYAAFIADNSEVIILENLRVKGFLLHDKFKSMNREHVEIVLDRMARFHALSFCFQDQNKEEFDKIFENYDSMSASELHVLEEVMLKLKDKLCTSLKQIDNEIAEEFNQKCKGDIWDVFRKVILDDVKEKVVTHCDGWNNNYLFHYKDNCKRIPIDVSILDWQFSNLHSPVLDLALILYSLTTENLSEYKRYLQFYHNKLTKFISDLGSNPEELFPFSTLMDHWKKYSFYGLMKTLAFLDLTLCNEEDAVSYNDMDPENYINELKSSETKKTNEVYYARLVCIIKHYCSEL